MFDSNDNGLVSGNAGTSQNPGAGAGTGTATMKAVYAVVERGGKSYWTRVGVGFVNRDASLTLKLDAVPIHGTLQVREWESAERFSGTPPGASDARPRREVRAGAAARRPATTDTNDGAPF